MHGREPQLRRKLQRVSHGQRVSNFLVPGIERADGLGVLEVGVPRLERGEPCARLDEFLLDACVLLLAAAASEWASAESYFDASFFCIDDLLDNLIDLARL